MTQQYSPIRVKQKTHRLAQIAASWLHLKEGGIKPSMDKVVLYGVMALGKEYPELEVEIQKILDKGSSNVN